MAGLLRATGQTITHDAWVWLGALSGQMLFYPPNVAGWNDRAWLDTSRLYGRWYVAQLRAHADAGDQRLLQRLHGDRRAGADEGDRGRRLARRSPPRRTPPCSRFAEQASPGGIGVNDFRMLRQNALRQLVASSPDAQLS